MSSMIQNTSLISFRWHFETNKEQDYSHSLLREIVSDIIDQVNSTFTIVMSL